MKFVLPMLALFVATAFTPAFAQQDPSSSTSQQQQMPPPSDKAILTVLQAQKANDDQQITILNARLVDFNQYIQQLTAQNKTLTDELAAAKKASTSSTKTK